ncbi:MAG: hypothetical protein ABIA04_13010 [Pseudomonadota bacterium]
MLKPIIKIKSLLILITAFAVFLAGCNESQRQGFRSAGPGFNSANQAKYAKFKQFQSLNRHRKQAYDGKLNGLKAQQDMMKEIMEAKMDAAKSQADLTKKVAIGSAIAVGGTAIGAGIAAAIQNRKAKKHAAANPRYDENYYKMQKALLESKKEIAIALINKGLVGGRGSCPKEKPELCGEAADKACQICKSSEARIDCRCTNYLNQFELSAFGGNLAGVQAWCDSRTKKPDTSGRTPAQAQPEAPDAQPDLPTAELKFEELDAVEEPEAPEAPVLQIDQCMADASTKGCDAVIEECAGDSSSTKYACSEMWSSCSFDSSPGCKKLAQSYYQELEAQGHLLQKESRSLAVAQVGDSKLYFDKDGNLRKMQRSNGYHEMYNANGESIATYYNAESGNFRGFTSATIEVNGSIYNISEHSLKETKSNGNVHISIEHEPYDGIYDELVIYNIGGKMVSRTKGYRSESNEWRQWFNAQVQAQNI